MAEAIQNSIILTRTGNAAAEHFGDDLAAVIEPTALRERLAPDAPSIIENQDVIRLKGGYALLWTPGVAADLAARLPEAVQPNGADKLSIDSDRRLRRVAPMVPAATAREVTDELPWNLREIGITGADTQPTGRGAKIAVLDSGFDLEHPDFQRRKRSKNDLDEGPDEPPPITVLNIAEGLDVRDENGHGTHVVGIIRGPLRPAGVPRYGIAPNAEVTVLNIIDDELTDWNLWKGIVQAAEDGAHVISISVGVAPQELHPTHSDLFERLAQILLDEYGTIIVAAAGNESNRREPYIGPIVHPADCPSILAVGAVNKKLEPAVSSSGGICNQRTPTLVAPGVGILSSFLSQNGHADHPYFSLNGTSAAAPHVAGVAALWVEKGYRGRDLVQKLIGTARNLGNGAAKPSRDFGWGLVWAPQE